MFTFISTLLSGWIKKIHYESISKHILSHIPLGPLYKAYGYSSSLKIDQKNLAEQRATDWGGQWWWEVPLLEYIHIRKGQGTTVTPDLLKLLRKSTAKILLALWDSNIYCYCACKKHVSHHSSLTQSKITAKMMASAFWKNAFYMSIQQKLVSIVNGNKCTFIQKTEQMLL